MIKLAEDNPRRKRYETEDGYLRIAVFYDNPIGGYENAILQFATADNLSFIVKASDLSENACAKIRYRFGNRKYNAEVEAYTDTVKKEMTEFIVTLSHDEHEEAILKFTVYNSHIEAEVVK